LEAEERARAAASARAASEEERRRAQRDREAADERRRAAGAAEAAARAFEARRLAMTEWHASFARAIGPVLTARERLYARLPHRRFRSARAECDAFRLAVADAERLLRTAPGRAVDALARDLLTVYRESARLCVEGSYFSFTVREAQVRALVAQLIDALAPYGLAFPRAPAGARGSGE
jgi:hypothetical protein